MSQKRFDKDDKSYEAAFDRALTLLEYRARTAQEMRRALHDREFDAETSEAVVERLCQIGLIDDEAYAKALVALSLRRGQGTRRARYALKMRGVSDDAMQSALDEVDPDTEFDAALLCAKKLWDRYEAFPERERAGKIYRALAGRGFHYEIISRVLRTLDRDLTEEY